MIYKRKLWEKDRSRVKKTIIIVRLAIYGSPYWGHHVSSISISGLLLRGFRSSSYSTLKYRCECTQRIPFWSSRIARFRFWLWKDNFLAAWRKTIFRETTCQYRLGNDRLLKLFLGPYMLESHRRYRLFHFFCI